MNSEPAKTAEPGVGASAGIYDVHFHYVPDAYREVAIASGFGVPDGMPGLPAWSEALMLDMMAQNGIEKGFLSISSPGVHFGDDAVARVLARRTNEEGARLKTVYAGQLGLFAAIPLPDVDGALREIEYALDVLGADGIYLQSNAGGIYPGESNFEPIFTELNRRGSVIFIHPTSPACPCCGPRERQLPRPVLEFMFETTRAVTSMILSGTLKRCPNVKIIVPHGGATLSVLADRIAMIADLLPNMGELPGAEILPALATLYYDLAGVPTPRQLSALRTFADPSHLFYGSDWPHTPQRVVAKLRSDLEGFLSSEQDLLADIRRRNAQRLFTRLVSGSPLSPYRR
jgi:predicted TIM-barrel fold metal-dependent hydrolase